MPRRGVAGGNTVTLPRPSSGWRAFDTSATSFTIRSEPSTVVWCLAFSATACHWTMSQRGRGVLCGTPSSSSWPRAAGGALRFNLKVYRQLDVASRRLYLFLTKLFFRQSVTSRLDVVEVAEQILGVARSVSLRDKKAKLQRCIDQLTRHDVIQRGEVTRVGKGKFTMVLHRGSVFRRPVMEPAFESPLHESLLTIGFDVPGADRILRRFKHRIGAGMGRYHPGGARTVWASLLQTWGPGILDG